MALSAPRDYSHQLSAIRPLARALYDSTHRSSSLSQARNELGLLVTVLGATESYSSVLCIDGCRPTLAKTLQNCYSGLLDLQKLQQFPSGAKPQNRISDIRARFSSLIFDLSVVNADMSISSQQNVDRLLRGFIDDIRAGKRDASVIAGLFDDTVSSSQKENSWKQLQQDLQRVGISQDLSSQDKTFIMSTLRQAVEEKDLLTDIHQHQHISNSPRIPTTSQSENHELAANARSRATSLSSNRGHSDKEVYLPENLPIPVATELQDTADWAKQALPRNNLPIPVASGIPFTSDDSNKQVHSQDNYPIPVATGSSSETHSESSSAGSNTTSSRITRGKKPSIMSRMKFKLISNKEEFISLIQMGGMYSVKLALDKGADANTYNVQGHTALMVAASYGHKDIVELLLEYGALPDKVSNRGDTALGVAALRGFEDIVHVLLAKGAGVDYGQTIGKTALSQAAESGQEKIVWTLLDRGASVNALCHTGDTALSQAAQGGHVTVARLLLDRGALVDHTAYPRKTPLFKAVEQNRPEMVRLLMERGANATREESILRRTPLYLATTLGRAEILATFKQSGYDVGSYQFH